MKAFRVWDKQEKKFLYGHYGEINVNFASLWSKYECVIRDDRYDLYPYTGVQDAFGRDIYEGDIVELYENTYCCGLNGIPNLSEKNLMPIICWREIEPHSPSGKDKCQSLCSVVHWNPECLTWGPIESSSDDFFQRSLLLVCKYKAVIGNVYESPDLMERLGISDPLLEMPRSIPNV